MRQSRAPIKSAGRSRGCLSLSRAATLDAAAPGRSQNRVGASPNILAQNSFGSGIFPCFQGRVWVGDQKPVGILIWNCRVNPG